MSDEVRRSMPLFSMGIVQSLTALTPRQIRYYEQNGLVTPARSKGNQRLFSFNDVDRLLEIKSLVEKGVNLAGIRQVFDLKQERPRPDYKPGEVQEVYHHLSEKELRKMLRKEIENDAGKGNFGLRQGELSRFFH
ncbi:MerR family transcriptional regulator [Salimicrobium jeotgali]|uniref:MerR family transcriptional regulator n=1 Tax=Salimicrobium jeotgali TaxID=1230341 RepID=UPI000C8647F4|nr:MerR family transcriptional regulator [Salimicrobium jeotgali]